MDARSQRELSDIKSELRRIINEMQDISDGMRKDFSGIGNDYCADAIDIVISRYSKALTKLNNVNTSRISEAFLEANGSGGSHGGGSHKF